MVWVKKSASGSLGVSSVGNGGVEPGSPILGGGGGSYRLCQLGEMGWLPLHRYALCVCSKGWSISFTAPVMVYIDGVSFCS